MVSLEDSKYPKNFYKLEDGSLVSTTDRFCQEVNPVATNIPSDEDIFNNESGLPNESFIKNHFYLEGRLTESQVMQILRLGTALLTAEDNLLKIEAPLISKLPRDQHTSLRA